MLFSVDKFGVWGENALMRTKTFWVKLALVVLMLLFVWGNSLLPASVSGDESNAVLRLVRPLVAAVQGVLARHGHELAQEYLVRKIAHFTEYAVLGALMLALFTKPGLRVMPLPSAALCLAAALLDEGIQIFSEGRGPRLRDVLLDFTGACFGIALVWLFVLLARLIRKIKNGA